MTKYTSELWATQSGFPTNIVLIADVKLAFGDSIYPSDYGTRYARLIASTRNRHGFDARAHAAQIVAAHNNTYAAGINPEAVKDLRSVLTSALKWWGVGRPAPTWVVDAQAALAKAKLP